jgi:hypothetical protein
MDDIFAKEFGGHGQATKLPRFNVFLARRRTSSTSPRVGCQAAGTSAGPGQSSSPANARPVLDGERATPSVASSRPTEHSQQERVFTAEARVEATLGVFHR